MAYLPAFMQAYPLNNSAVISDSVDGNRIKYESFPCDYAAILSMLLANWIFHFNASFIC